MTSIKIITLALGLAGLLAIMQTAHAEEPVPGAVISSDNLAEYEQYFTSGAIELIKRGATFKVMPTTPNEKLHNKVWAAATQANKGKAKVSDIGTLSTLDDQPWIGGTPFPEPESGMEIMANFQSAYLGLEGDDWGSVDGPKAPFSRFLYINDKGAIYKDTLVGGSEYHMNGRLNFGPLGTVPGHEDETLRRIFVFMAPYDVKGIVTLDIQYRDGAKLPDSYIYLPNFRRVRRVATSNRADSVAGSEFGVSDLGGFADPLGMWDYKILEKRKMLVATTGQEASPSKGDMTLVNGYFLPEAPVEFRDAYVVEATPKYDTIFSRKVLVINAETFGLFTGEFYDKAGKLYKLYQQAGGHKEDGSPVPSWSLILNTQTEFATILAQFGVEPNLDVPVRLMEPANLKEFSR